MSDDELDARPAHELPATISQPARRALDSVGITSLQDLARWSKADISHLHGMGPKGIRLLREAMAEYGLGFRQPA
jgi:predicted flap endonuclease-1-like 5' DNA nuclease